MSDTAPPYANLSPETLLQALESAGFRPDGSVLALNSYENRVYQIGIEDDRPVVAKFYRPGRWSDAAILEEHAFSLTLAQEEIPVVAPLRNAEGETLHRFEGFRFSLFPRHGGRWPELDSPDNLGWIGRFLGRIHQVGATRPFLHRPSIDPKDMGRASVLYLLEEGFIPPELTHRYREIADRLQLMIEAAFEAVSYTNIRLHGDCHPGNILWTDQGPHFVDLDDCHNGPAIQDLWMLLSGDRNERTLQLDALREGYEMFRTLDPGEVALIEPLRTLRMIHYAAWLARRWHDPAFPSAFPWFNTPQYWQDHIAQLEQQVRELGQSPLPLY
ncbi:MAG TPA: serine/threonine protein kinase [Chromatiales bacterium]|nr:serine/threonine protein kinase [Chromatiales bacterium]